METIRLKNVLPFEYDNFWVLYKALKNNYYMGLNYNDIDEFTLSYQYKDYHPSVPEEYQKKMMDGYPYLFEFLIDKSFLEKAAFEHLKSILPTKAELMGILKVPAYVNPIAYETFTRKMCLYTID